MTSLTVRRRAGLAGRGPRLAAAAALLLSLVLPPASGAGPQAAPQEPPAAIPPEGAETQPAEVAPAAPLEDLPVELEGVALDQTLQEVSRRLELGSLVPGREGNLLRYVIDVQRMLPSPVQDKLVRSHITRMDLEFRRERVSSVKVEYSDQRDTPFDEMARALALRYGPPSRSTASGPLQVGRAKGLRLYLWLETWTWERGGRTFTVEGKHYGDNKAREESKRHAYAYRIEASP